MGAHPRPVRRFGRAARRRQGRLIPPLRRLSAAAALAATFGSLPLARADAPDATVVISSTPLASLHPVFSEAQSEAEAASLLFRPLVWPTLDHRVDPFESLAAAIVPGDGDTTFRVTLRPWHWSDGTEVTSADVLFDWSLIRAMGHAYADYGDGGVPDAIASVRAVDARTVLFTLRRPINPRLFTLSGLGQFVPLPHRAWGSIPLARQQVLQSEPRFYAVVDGPYRLAALDPGRDAVFIRNERFDGHRAGYARLVLDFLPDADVLEGLRSGELDIAFVPDYLAARARALPGFHVLTLRSRGSFYSIMLDYRNRAVPFFRDLRVRQAIARAIDQPRIVRDAMNGLGAPRYGFIPSTQPGWLAPDLRGGASPVGYDPAAARRLLDAAGLRPGRDGVRFGFTVLLEPDDASEIAQFEMIEVELRAVGVVMRIHLLAFDQLEARLEGPSDGWEAIAMGHTSSAFPDMTSLFGTGGADNDGGYSDERTDALLATVARSDDPAAFVALQDRIAADQPVIFRPETVLTLVGRDTVAGVDRLYALGSNLAAEYLHPVNDRTRANGDGKP